MSISHELGTVVVGGGPAGLALLLAARQSGLLPDLLSSGLRIIERNQLVGTGEIGNYAIRSDSLADSFLKAIDPDPSLHCLLQRPAGARLNAHRGSPIDLASLSHFLADLALELRSELRALSADPFRTGLDATGSFQQPDGSWITHFSGSLALHSRALVLATGASQPVSRLYQEKVAGIPLLPRFAHKTVQSGEFLGSSGPRIMAEMLRGRRTPKVAIVGGSHSAIASAHISVHKSAGIPFGSASITVLHRGNLRLTYASPTAALADGFSDFCPADICPKTGRVFPLAGFRCDARDLLRQYWGLGGLPRLDTLRLFQLEASKYEEANQILQDADLIVAALGYRPRALPLLDAAHKPIPLLADAGGPLVDDQSRVLNADGYPVPGVFALGLAAGYPLAGVHGEPSFKGQANGLALWQSDIGRQIVTSVLAEIHRDSLIPEQKVS